MSPPRLEGRGERHIRGPIRDISRGGVGLLTNQVVEVPQLLRCEIVLAGSRLVIPTLMRVRWCQKSPRGFRYRAGLQFLLT